MFVKHFRNAHFLVKQNNEDNIPLPEADINIFVIAYS